MTNDLGTYERLVAAWRNAETKAEALRQFRTNGGQHRIRVTTDNDNAVIDNLLGAMMDGKGFAAILNSAVSRAENEAAEAKAALLGQATRASLLNVGSAPC